MYPKHTLIHVIGAKEREDRRGEDLGSWYICWKICSRVIKLWCHIYLQLLTIDIHICIITSLPLLVCMRANLPSSKMPHKWWAFYLQMGLYKVFLSHLKIVLCMLYSFSTILSIKMKYWPIFSWGDYYINGFIGYHPQEDLWLISHNYPMFLFWVPIFCQIVENRNK